MLRLLILLCFFISTNFLFGQRPIEKLVQAEKDFAAYSVANSTKEAFLKFLDSNGVVFNNGKPENGIESWLKKEKRPGVLNWHPQFAEISASDNFGYTTGPWTFQPKTIEDSVAARGQYTTVWHINQDGEWKFLVDLGSINVPHSIKDEALQIERINQDFNAGNNHSLMKAEKKFIRASKKSFREAYKKYTSVLFCLLNRNNNTPAWFQDAYTNVFNSMPLNITYTIVGSGKASSGDLAYVYGTTVINDKTDNYLRIWRKEKEGWKIAVEVLRY